MSGFTRAVLKGLVSVQKRWPPTETLIKRRRGWSAALARVFTPAGKTAVANLAGRVDWLCAK